MRILLFIAILPCILANEIIFIDCPDGTQCPISTVCCGKVTGGMAEKTTYGCCDLPESEKENKKLVPGMSSTSQLQHRNQSAPAPESGPDGVVQQATCPGTWCSPTACCTAHKFATCCANSINCCPSGFKCCGLYNVATNWCCARSLRCHSSAYGYCIAGAAALSPAITCLVSLILLLGVLKMKI